MEANTLYDVRKEACSVEVSKIVGCEEWKLEIEGRSTMNTGGAL